MPPVPPSRRANQGTVLVVYYPLSAEEAQAVEQNVRAGLGAWCEEHEWHRWTFDGEQRSLFATATIAADAPEQLAMGLCYLAWDALEHFSRVIVSLDALVWKQSYHTGEEEDYRQYREETRPLVDREWTAAPARNSAEHRL